MQAARKITFGVAAAWAGRAIGILGTLILMPVLFRFLAPDELGVWFLLSGAGAFVAVLDLGFSPTLTRHIAFALGKADRGEAEPQNEVADLIASSRTVYRWLSLTVFVIAWPAGIAYLHALDLRPALHESAWLAWTVLCAGHAVTLWSGIVGCILTGLGDVGWESLLTSVTFAATVAGNIIVLSLGAGLVGLALVWLVAELVRRGLGWMMIRRRHPILFAQPGTRNRQLVREMLVPTRQKFLLNAGGLATSKSQTYIVAWMLSASAVPNLAAALMLFNQAAILPLSLIQSAAPFISRASRARDPQGTRRLALRAAGWSSLLALVFCGGVLLFGRPLLDLWLGPGHYLGPWIMLLIGLAVFLETHQGAWGQLAQALGRVPWRIWLVLGIASVVAMLVGGRLDGLRGLCIGRVLPGLTLGAWILPRLALRELQALPSEPVSPYVDERPMAAPVLTRTSS